MHTTHTVPTRQNELDNADQESICPERPTPSTICAMRGSFQPKQASLLYCTTYQRASIFTSYVHNSTVEIHNGLAHHVSVETRTLFEINKPKITLCASTTTAQPPVNNKITCTSAYPRHWQGRCYHHMTALMTTVSGSCSSPPTWTHPSSLVVVAHPPPANSARLPRDNKRRNEGMP